MSETPPTPVTYNSAPLLNKSRLVDQTSGGPSGGGWQRLSKTRSTFTR
jgi:hypothetical protein